MCVMMACRCLWLGAQATWGPEQYESCWLRASRCALSWNQASWMNISLGGLRQLHHLPTVACQLPVMTPPLWQILAPEHAIYRCEHPHQVRSSVSIHQFLTLDVTLAGSCTHLHRPQMTERSREPDLAVQCLHRAASLGCHEVTSETKNLIPHLNCR